MRTKTSQFFLVIVSLFIGWVLFAPGTHAASTTSIAGTVTSSEAGDCDDTDADGTGLWSTTLSAYQTSNDTDGTYGGSAFDSGDFGAKLELSNFHFSSSISSGSRIDGIEVNMERGGSSGDIKDYKVWLTASSSVRKMGSNNATSTVAWSTVDQISTFGGSGDLWSVNNTTGAATSSFNGYATSTSFGFIFCAAAIGANGTASVDRVTITVYYTAPTPALTQDGYRWRANHQGETGTTWLAVEDTVLTGANNVTASTTRLRILVDETASVATTTLYQLEYATSTSAGCSALTYVPVADQASSTGYAWKMSPTAKFANGGATTNIADPNGLTDTTGSFRAGVTQDTASRLSTGIAHSAGEFTELEWSLEAKASTGVNGQSYCFRATNADSATNFTYSAYPKINLATSSPTLSQLHYRWRANHQGETGTTWLANEDTPINTFKTASTTRLRMLFDETSGRTGTTTLYQLEYATSTISGYAGCSALAIWARVPHTASSTSFAWIATSTAQLVNRGSATNVGSGVSDPASGSFVTGQVLDRNSTTTSFSIPVGDDFTEIEWTLQANAYAEGDSYCFRVTNADSTANITYAAYARANMATTTFTQSHFRIYKNINAITPITPWDNFGVDQNMTSTSSTEFLGVRKEFRLRMNVTAGTIDLPADAHTFGLEYAELNSQNSCSAISAGDWRWVGDTQSGFLFVNNASLSNTEVISDTTPLASDTGGLYSEVQAGARNPNAAIRGKTIEYDWALKYRSSLFSLGVICFRMTQQNGEPLSNYSGYPRIITTLIGIPPGGIPGREDLGRPTGGEGRHGAATSTGGTRRGGDESGGDTPPDGNGDEGGGGGGGGGETFGPLFRFFATAFVGFLERIFL